jgi:hypothetical protein
MTTIPAPLPKPAPAKPPEPDLKDVASIIGTLRNLYSSGYRAIQLERETPSGKYRGDVGDDGMINIAQVYTDDSREWDRERRQMIYAAPAYWPIPNDSGCPECQPF